MVAVGEAFVMGTSAQELTPRFPISVESSGIPARVDDVDVDAGDEATVLEPEAHIPDDPAVVAIPELVDNPDVAEVPDAVLGAVAAVADAVAGGAVPLSVIPPPS